MLVLPKILVLYSPFAAEGKEFSSHLNFLTVA
ncbi:Uncharacterised protein [Yersinia enterocolitica]|nr:Uncharacterised protein [Yersinia frederiksenii]CNL28056.1 Uncharacterised protein [Yersinia frederiksenii]CQJ16937.1 Uncharacterised protein [Yersinia enterocolitica]